MSQCEHERIRAFPVCRRSGSAFHRRDVRPAFRAPPTPALEHAEFPLARTSGRQPGGAGLVRGVHRAVSSRCCSRSSGISSSQHGTHNGPRDLAAIVLTGLACSVLLCFGEYFFHRYILHIETVRFLRSLCTSHLTHHKLTFITFDERPAPFGARIRSLTPNTTTSRRFLRGRSSRSSRSSRRSLRRWHSRSRACRFSSAATRRLPSPISSTRLLTRPITSRTTPSGSRASNTRGSAALWTWLYGFHQAHHANYKCNLNVAGFFGMPLADLAFGTYRQPDPLLVDGAPATKAHARRLTPSPRWPISWLDRVVFKRRRWMVKRP